MLRIAAQIDEAAQYIRRRWARSPRVGIILGSGLASVGEAIALDESIEYGSVPHFVSSTAMGHPGRLLCGRLADVPVVAMQGRLHLYEGYSARQATLPVRVMRRLGVELLVVSNAAGGLDPSFRCGDIMLIDDHINLLHHNPLIGINDDSLGPRFPDMSSPYDRRLGEVAQSIARGENFACHRGTYVAMLGPTYETRAEIRMLRRIGGDAVGMSTVPEVIVAAHCALAVLGLSIITNICSPDAAHVASGEAVVATAGAASAKLRAIVTGVVEREFGPSSVV